MVINLNERIGDESVIQQTRLTRKLNVGGSTQTYPVFRIRLDCLRYNVQNDRIATWVSEYREEHDGSSPDENDAETFNGIIEDYISKSNPESLNMTEASIAEDGQVEPGVVLSNGVVIDGNRRFTCLRRLARGHDKYNWFEASILPETLGNDRETVKCLELQLQFKREERVGYDPIDRLVGVYRDLIDPETRIDTLTPEKYARSAGIPIQKLQGYMARANLMVEFLDYIGAPKKFSLARNLKIDGPLGELENLFKKCRDEEEITRVKGIAFANILAEPRDITRFMRDLKRIVASDESEAFLDTEDELAARVIDRLADMDEVNASVIRDEIRGDIDLKNEMLKTVDDALDKARRTGLLNSPVEMLTKAKESVEKIDTLIIEHLDASQRDSVLDAVEGIRSLLDGIELAARGEKDAE